MPGPNQLALLEMPPTLAKQIPEPGVDYGEVFTRRWVVELILDLVGYTADKDLAAQVIVEPSCGTGAFLLPILERLLESSSRHGHELSSLGNAILALDLLNSNAERALKAVALRLQEAGLDQDKSVELAASWVSTGDFLLQGHRLGCADYVVGNPPYIRLENVPRPIMEEYRRLCSTMRGRSDVYVGFIERGLGLLSPGGSLGFICADRWMRNQYGSDLREFVSRRYAVDAVIAMHDVDAFEDEVSAYPAIVVLRNGPRQRSVVAEAKAGFGQLEATKLSAWVRGAYQGGTRTRNVEAARVDCWAKGRDLWPAGSPAQLALVAYLEARFPPLEDQRTRTRVGIGVASGCDGVYLTRDPGLVEKERLLPILQATDLVAGRAAWSGTYLVNPWDKHGLVDLGQFPLLANYFETNKERLNARHVARHRPAQWYRTIDRVDPTLLGKTKLLLPDLKASACPVVDEGKTYPHHNLYFVVSDGWDIEVLGGLLLSDVTNLIVGAYCVKMRGGCYRFQAQYLRRIRVPQRESVSKRDQQSLAAAFDTRDVEAATALAVRLYGLEDSASLFRSCNRPR